MINITKDNFKQEVLESPIPVLVDFYADWCGPCKMLAPVLEQVEAQVGDSVKVVKINTDDAQSLAMQYSISTIPTLILFKNGEETNRHSGFMNKNDVISFIEK